MRRHLSHGANFHESGKRYKVLHYGVHKDTERIDYDEIEKFVGDFQKRKKKNRSNIFIFAYFHLILNETGPPCDENCCWQGLGSRLSSQNWDAGGFLDVTALICSRLA